MTARAPLHTGELLISLGLIALGTFVIAETRTIAETQAYAQIGPRLFPYIIGCGLTLCGAVLAWQAVARWMAQRTARSGARRAGLGGVRHHHRRRVPAHGDHRLGGLRHRLDGALRPRRAGVRQPPTRA
jgi:hypothetical protein